MNPSTSLRAALNASTLSLALTLGVTALPVAQAADTMPSAAAPRDNREARDLKTAREHIARKDWPAAVGVLQPLSQAYPDNADAFNLLGYSLRNLKRYDESLAAYDRALTINPNHRGALEYQGIAYVEMGRMDPARAHLARLDRLCTFSCEEYRSLKKAIETGSSGSY